MGLVIQMGLIGMYIGHRCMGFPWRSAYEVTLSRGGESRTLGVLCMKTSLTSNYSPLLVCLGHTTTANVEAITISFSEDLQLCSIGIRVSPYNFPVLDNGLQESIGWLGFPSSI